MGRPEPRVLTPSVLRDRPLPRPGDDKHARGQVLVVGGGLATPGAVLLAGESALRAGAGKLQVATVAGTAPAVAVALPEAAVHGLPERNGEVSPEATARVLEVAHGCDAVLLGTGAGDVEAAASLLERLVPRLDGPVVLDALGSSFLTRHPDGLHHLAGRSVLTVNPVELARTAHRSEEEVAADPVGVAREVAAASRVVVVCGGTEKHVVGPDGEAWVVPGGGPGLGVSGSGDVQAGVVAGLLARGADPALAALWGAHLHARAGERLASAVGNVGFLARELPGQVPALLAELA
ncbi:NAD(P)H-hydrate dehydratase [Nocardioides solisilvae]|uniref:NAD(P)H-hydrate dehydratase n=1 Tax=Nocardioides solisilvae TaxID=1542435 RepID=UPI000D74248D|nr:NAD(P)H-hydrate dehydratase [Nocardioides solisilvae]